jgi:hypothetical protein
MDTDMQCRNQNTNPGTPATIPERYNYVSSVMDQQEGVKTTVYISKTKQVRFVRVATMIRVSTKKKRQTITLNERRRITMYKLTRPDGFDFYSGTINYREAIGTIIRVIDFDPPEKGPCGKGLHASTNPNDCFIGAKIPCAAFRVEGLQPIAKDNRKTRYRALEVIEEITDLDDLFGWNYLAAISPIHPFDITPPEITEKHVRLLKTWASVRAGVLDSVGESVGKSVWASVRASVRESVDSVRESVWESVWSSVRESVRESVWESVGAYIGSFFPNIKKWRGVDHKKGVYPFQPTVTLWKQGLVPSYDGKIWRLHGGKKAEILFSYRGE